MTWGHALTYPPLAAPLILYLAERAEESSRVDELIDSRLELDPAFRHELPHVRTGSEGLFHCFQQRLNLWDRTNQRSGTSSPMYGLALRDSSTASSSD